MYTHHVCLLQIACPRDARIYTVDLPYIRTPDKHLVFALFIGCNFSNAVSPCPACINAVQSTLCSHPEAAFSPLRPFSPAPPAPSDTRL